MAFSPEYRLRVENSLGTIVPITTRPMFGGLGIYSKGLFFALIDEDRLYFKVNDSNRPDFEARAMGPFIPYDGAKPMMGYYELPPDLLDHAEELETWIDKSLAVAEIAARKKKR